MRLILNADDLGYSLDVNEAVFELMARRKISSATLLAGGTAIDDAVRRHREFPACSFGVHLNLTDFSPLTNHTVWRRYHLVDADGAFNAAIRSARPAVGLLKAVVDEWSAQIEVLTRAGVAISHLDSHHHVHTIPWLFPALKVVQKRYGIRKVRCSLNLYSRSQKISFGLAFGKYLWNLGLRKVFLTTTTDYFTHLPWLLEQLPRRTDLENKTIEVMVHPGAADAAEEQSLLDTDWTRIAPRCRLISYRDLD
jgi:predicted glycoside hydrolase/deacetylase ChbG (UPF0249 family)